MAESANSLLRVQRSLFSMASVVQIGYTTLTLSLVIHLLVATRSVYPCECCVTYIMKSSSTYHHFHTINSVVATTITQKCTFLAVNACIWFISLAQVPKWKKYFIG